MDAAKWDPAVVGRFVADGRIAAYPARLGKRLQVLAWAADKVLRPGERIDEPQLNLRMAPLTDDPATLRRYLVDAGLITRLPDGTGYALAEGAAADGATG
jgi:hypothetical protein